MNKKEKILIKIIHLLSEKFKERIVLEGGMLLRLFNSPRSTQDIDYYFLSDKSKKLLVKDIEKVLSQFNEATILKVTVNSRGIFVDMEGVEEGVGTVMVEINVVPSLHMPSDHVSTVALSNQYSLTGRIVATIALPEAFAHKIAACIERRSMRDLYDISIFDVLCDFDRDTLHGRFQGLSIKRKKPQAITFEMAADWLEKRVNYLSEELLRDELYPLIPSEQQAGLAYVIKAAVMRVVQKLRNN